MRKTNVKAMAIAMASILSVSMVGAMSSSAADTTTPKEVKEITNSQKSESITYIDGSNSFTSGGNKASYTDDDFKNYAITKVKYYAVDDTEPATGTDPSKDLSAKYTITVPATIIFGEGKDTEVSGEAEDDVATGTGEVSITGVFDGTVSVKPSGTNGEFTMKPLEGSGLSDITATAILSDAKLDNANSSDNLVSGALILNGSTSKQHTSSATLTIGWKDDNAPIINTWTGWITYTVTKTATPAAGE